MTCCLSKTLFSLKSNRMFPTVDKTSEWEIKKKQPQETTLTANKSVI